MSTKIWKNPRWYLNIHAVFFRFANIAASACDKTPILYRFCRNECNSDTSDDMRHVHIFKVYLYARYILDYNRETWISLGWFSKWKIRKKICHEFEPSYTWWHMRWWREHVETLSALQWRHNEGDCVSNHQTHDCLLNRLFRRRSKKHQSSASLVFVWGIHRSLVNSPHKDQWRRALIFSLICVWINGWVNNREAGDLRRYRAHYDVSVMNCTFKTIFSMLLFQHEIRTVYICYHQSVEFINLLTFWLPPLFWSSVLKIESCKIHSMSDILVNMSMKQWISIIMYWPWALNSNEKHGLSIDL